MTVLAMLLAFLATAATGHAPAKKSAPDKAVVDKSVPDKAALDKAEALIVQVHAADEQKAKTPQQKTELAKRYLIEGAETKDNTAARFVLLSKANNLAARYGDVATSFAAIDALAAEFNVDPAELKGAALTEVIKTLRQPKEYVACANFLTPMIEEAVAADQYANANRFADLAIDCARQGQDSAKLRALVLKKKQLQEDEAEFEKTITAKAIIKLKPNDPQANLVMGKYLCLVKQDWRAGLPLLVAGADDALKAPAALELERKPDALRLGDAWWQAADKLDGQAKLNVQIHAGQWYSRALPTLGGLTKAKVEKILDQLPAASLLPPPAPQTPLPAAPPAEGVAEENLREYLISNKWKRTVTVNGEVHSGKKESDAPFVFNADGSCAFKGPKGTTTGARTWSLVGDELVFGGGKRFKYKDGQFQGAVSDENSVWTFSVMNENGKDRK